MGLMEVSNKVLTSSSGMSFVKKEGDCPTQGAQNPQRGNRVSRGAMKVGFEYVANIASGISDMVQNMFGVLCRRLSDIFVLFHSARHRLHILQR